MGANYIGPGSRPQWMLELKRALKGSPIDSVPKIVHIKSFGEIRDQKVLQKLNLLPKGGKKTVSVQLPVVNTEQTQYERNPRSSVLQKMRM